MRSLAVSLAALAGGALSLAILSGGSGASAAAAIHPDLRGVWVGLGRSGDPRFATTPYMPRPEFTPWGAAESKRLQSDSHTDCGLSNPVQFMDGRGVFPMQILDGGNQIVVLNEAMVQPRRIFVDGRPHPAELDATWLGHSIGRWEGDILVVDTIGLNGRERPLNNYALPGPTARVSAEPRLPTSDQHHLVERIRLIQGGRVLEDEMTVTDPKTFTHPFSFKQYFQRSADLDIAEFECGTPDGDGR